LWGFCGNNKEARSGKYRQRKAGDGGKRGNEITRAKEQRPQEKDKDETSIKIGQTTGRARSKEEKKACTV